MALTSHGFSWPAGMPPCGVCARDANNPMHVTPAARVAGNGLRGSVLFASEATVGGALPTRPHPYLARSQAALNVLCTACGQPLSAPVHPVGTPSRIGLAHPTPAAASITAQMATPVQGACFAMEYGGKVILAARGDVISLDAMRRDRDGWPDGVSEVLRQQANHPASAHTWIAGRYVEADHPNSNAAYWTTGDLELGAPGIAHGPVNYLHEASRVIGAIAAAELVAAPQAAAGEAQLGNHIVAVSALWGWVAPKEVDTVAQASADGKLYYSMECVARQVQCLAEDCTGQPLEYRTYVAAEAARCDHMRQGAPRRFIDPIFLGGAVIVPPVRPGWDRAQAHIMTSAGAAAERQAASLGGLSTTEAEEVVAAAMFSAERNG